MIFCPFSSRPWLVAVLGFALAQTSVTLAGEEKSPAENPPSSVQPLRKDGLQRLEEQLSRSLQGIAPRNLPMETDPVRHVIPPKPAVPSKRVQELIEKQKNWIYMSPEDFSRAPKIEDIFHLPSLGPDGKELKKSTALDRFYERLSREARGEQAKQMNGPDESNLIGENRSEADSENRADERRSDQLPAGVKNSQEELQRMMEQERKTREDAATSKSSFRNKLTDIFGLGATDDAEEKKEPNPYLKQYRELLNGLGTPAPGTAVSAERATAGLDAAMEGQPLTTPAVQPFVYSPSIPDAPRRDFADTPGGAYKPNLSPLTSIDVNTRVLNSWNPFYSLPTPAPPPRLSRPKPMVEAPRRSF